MSNSVADYLNRWNQGLVSGSKSLDQNGAQDLPEHRRVEQSTVLEFPNGQIIKITDDGDLGLKTVTRGTTDYKSCADVLQAAQNLKQATLRRILWVQNARRGRQLTDYTPPDMLEDKCSKFGHLFKQLEAIPTRPVSKMRLEAGAQCENFVTDRQKYGYHDEDTTLQTYVSLPFNVDESEPGTKMRLWYVMHNMLLEELDPSYMAEIFVPVRRKYTRFVFMQIWEILFPSFSHEWLPEDGDVQDSPDWFEECKKTHDSARPKDCVHIAEEVQEALSNSLLSWSKDCFTMEEMFVSIWNEIQGILDNLDTIAGYRLRDTLTFDKPDNSEGYEAVPRGPEVDVLELRGGIFNR